MEPISLALGVFPLAVEVASTARKVKDAVASYKAAASEVRSLTERLAMLEGLCEDISHGLAAQRCSDGRFGARNSVSVALKLCRAKLAEIDTMLAKFESGTKKGRIRFVVDKDKIRNTCRDLDSLIQMLNLGLSANFLVSCIVPSPETAIAEPKTATCHDVDAGLHSTAVDHDDHSDDERLDIAIGPRPRQIAGAVVRREKRETQWYRGSLGQVDYRQNMRETRWSGAADEGLKSQTSVFSVMLPWSRRRLDLQFQRSSFAPLSFSLHVAHVLEWDTPVGKLLDEIMYRNDLPRFQELLSSRQLSIYSVVDRSNLLHRAIRARWPELCRLLAQQDRGGWLSEELGPENIAAYYCYGDCSPTTETMRRAREVLDVVLDLKQDDLTADILEFMYATFGEPEQCLPLLKAFIRHSDEGISAMMNVAWVSAATRYIRFGMPRLSEDGDLPPDPRRFEWKPVLRELIRLGVDVHQPLCLRHEFGRKDAAESAYITILERASFQLQVEAEVREWLCFLEESGVNLSMYLERELASEWRHRADVAISLIECRGHAAAVWRWTTDHRGHASEVLEEFTVMAHGFLSSEYALPWKTHWVQDAGGPLRYWHAISWQPDWPFRRSLVCIAEQAKRERWLPTEFREACQRYFDNYQRRLDRRWFERKMGKRKWKKMGSQGTMPGSWVE